MILHIIRISLVGLMIGPLAVPSASAQTPSSAPRDEHALSQYRQWIRAHTGTNPSPDEIHAIGLKEVGRIRTELARAGAQFVKPSFPFQTEDQVLAAYRTLNDKVKAALPRLFARLPEAPLEVAPQPDPAVSVDRYSPQTEDGTRPGVFWAAIGDPRTFDAGTMAARFLRAGQPGYHIQMALEDEIALPASRQRASADAFREGWALYAASLGMEMGLYNDIAAYVGELRLEMASAARLVVDTGIHTRQWTRRQAIDYLMANAGLSESQAQGEVEQCVAQPAQALAEGLGFLKIRALRERAKAALGARFEMPAFHDAVLGEGALPLDLLDVRIEQWIKKGR